jgi:sugar phosphate isomerase/epimerase
MILGSVKFCLFSSTPDIESLGFLVRVLTGSFAELAQTSVEWGFDGIEFMPDPERILDPVKCEKDPRAAGADMPVVNTGRMAVQGMALFHEDASIRKKSREAFKNILEFAGHFGSRVGLGVARGAGIPGASGAEMDQLAEDTFRELAEHAQKAGTVIMLEAAETNLTSFVNRNEEAIAWVERIKSPAFSVMLDVHQLQGAEPSLEHGIRATRGQARHIHLYDPGRWPPRVRPEEDRLDWPRIVQLLKEERFSGSASVVLVPEGDPEPAARKTARYLRDLFNW